jgi:uncharacterized LabA/DUF88 family protein
VGKNVAVFVDVANIFYAAKAAGVDIDYVTLLKAGSAGRDLVRAYAYTGLDPDNENQRNFHDFLRRNGYKVVSKDIRKYGDGKVKANLDIELVVDMMKTARNLDVAIVVSGDGDFAPAIRAVQEMGVRVEVVSFRGNTSSDLIDVADLFTDIVQIAKVEKGSSRSGRRVAADDDLSMTEVPDKMTEGTGDRSRGRGRTRRAPAAAAAAAAASPSGRTRRAAPIADAGDAPIVVLPGEKLSRAGVAASAVDGAEPEFDEAGEELEPGAVAAPAAEGGEELGEEGPRRRRRRGGRGRGRSRGREDAPFADAAAAPAREPRSPESADDAEEPDEMPAPARRAASAFGSVWDSQIGMPAARRSATPSIEDEEDFDEPSVPEYLITERRQRDGGRGGMRGGRGGRGGAYAAALDRERFGGGRGSTPSRFAEPAPRREGAFGRPDRNDRPDRGGRGGDRPPFRPDARPAPRASGDEPWSEVPPEIEAMLRAQLGARGPAAPRREAPAPSAEAPSEAAADAIAAPAPSRRGRKPAASAEAGDAAAMPAPAAEAAPAKARRAPARRTRTAASTGAAEADAPAEGAGAGEAAVAGKPTRARVPRATSTRKPSTKAAADSSGTEPAADAVATAPKKRAPRKKADAAG